MLQVQVDPAQLAAHGVTLDEVMATTADALDAGILQFSDGAVIGTGGFVDTPNQRLAVQHVPADRHRRGSGQGDRSTARNGERLTARATSPTSSRTTSRCSATRSSTTDPA